MSYIRIACLELTFLPKTTVILDNMYKTIVCRLQRASNGMPRRTAVLERRKSQAVSPHDPSLLPEGISQFAGLESRAQLEKRSLTRLRKYGVGIWVTKVAGS